MGLFDIFKGGASNDEIAYADLVAALEANACSLIDVREPHEFEAGRVPGSQNMPLSRFDAARLPTDRAVVLICRSGARSAGALARARASGRNDVRHYRGGVIGWSREGGELV
jgi:rhodanese-related sulfurtransferase